MQITTRTVGAGVLILIIVILVLSLNLIPHDYSMPFFKPQIPNCTCPKVQAPVAGNPPPCTPNSAPPPPAIQCPPPPPPPVAPTGALNDPLSVIWKLRNIQEKKVFSQNGEDGVIEDIFAAVGTRDKYYVEFGVQDCSECNTKQLFKNFGWSGLLMDGGGLPTGDSRVIQKEFITAEGIVGLFEKYQVPKKFDLLSVDIDSYDYWVTLAIFKGGYRPAVLITEINRNWKSDEPFTVPPDAPWVAGHFGCSAFGYYTLMKPFGYYPVYIEKQGVNMFFVNTELLAEIFKSDKNTILSILQLVIPFESIADPYVNRLIHTGDFNAIVAQNHFCRIKETGLVDECCKQSRTTPTECKPASAFVKPKN